MELPPDTADAVVSGRCRILNSDHPPPKRKTVPVRTPEGRLFGTVRIVGFQFVGKGKPEGSVTRRLGRSDYWTDLLIDEGTDSFERTVAEDPFLDDSAQYVWLLEDPVDVRDCSDGPLRPCDVDGSDFMPCIRMCAGAVQIHREAELPDGTSAEPGDYLVKTVSGWEAVPQNEWDRSWQFIDDLEG